MIVSAPFYTQIGIQKIVLHTHQNSLELASLSYSSTTRSFYTQIVIEKIVLHTNRNLEDCFTHKSEFRGLFYTQIGIHPSLPASCTARPARAKHKSEFRKNQVRRLTHKSEFRRLYVHRLTQTPEFRWLWVWRRRTQNRSSEDCMCTGLNTHQNSEEWECAVLHTNQNLDDCTCAVLHKNQKNVCAHFYANQKM